MSDPGPQEGNTSLFAVFALSLLSLVLVPYTISRLAALSAPDDEERPWEAGKSKPSRARAVARALASRRALSLWLLWGVWLALALYARSTATADAPFDPWEILQLDKGATAADARKAYRKLSLIYHPDKNPDPAATKYFAESITKAYKALTDDTARENYEKYGHPDGPQGMRMNIALPEWVFAKDSKTAPLLLGLLVAGGVLAPLVAACIFLWRAGNVVGVADVAPETVDIFLRSKWCVKEAHTVRAMPDTLVMAFEFITRPLARNQGAAMTALQRDVVTLLRPDLKDKAAWWKRRPSILKSEFIFIAHTARHPIPPELADDAAFHLAKAPALLDKVVEVARVPRTYGWPYGWLAPIIGAVEYAQCLAAGLPPHVRRPPPGKGGGPDPALAALPHVDGDALKRLARRKVRSVAELAALDAADRAAALTDAGLGDAAAADVGAALAALPRLALADAAAEVDGADGGSDDVRPGDLVTVSCRALLTRAAHDVPGATPPAAKVVAFAPHAGRRVVERWWVIVGDAARNVCFAVSPIDLREAERAAFHPAVRDGLARGATPAACASAAGATVSLAFEAPPPGKYDLTLYLLCDAWVGADASVPLKMKVSDVTRAEREGRVPGVVGRPPAAPSTKAPKRGSDDDDGAAPVADDDGAAGSDNEGAGRAARGGASDGGDDDDGDATDSDDREWDSEETGTEASSDDEAVVAAVAAARAKAGVARKASSSGAATPAAGASGAATPAAGASADKEIEAAE